MMEPQAATVGDGSVEDSRHEGPKIRPQERASDSTAEHQARAAADVTRRPVGCGVLTVSDTRTLQTDHSGDLVAEAISAGGHRVLQRMVVPDEPQRIEAGLRGWIADPAVELIVSTGGTGLARRDTTIEVVRRLLTIELEGFGELFRMLSWGEIGAAAMLSRATAGLVVGPGHQGETFIFALPGSPDAVRMAMRELIVPQIPHLVWLRR
jgi:molybdenum cofactor biosynthesis protein B